MRLIARRSALHVLAAVGLCITASRAGAQTGPLSLPEVLELHRAGVSAHRIGRVAQQYCISFPVTDSVARELGAEGAGYGLLDDLRVACANHARVLADGVLVDESFTAPTQFSGPDGLCSARSGPGGLTIENDRATGGCAIPYAAEEQTGAVRIELIVEGLSGTGAAAAFLGFGKDSATSDQFTVAVKANGDVEIGQITDGRFRRLRLVPRSRAVKLGAGAQNVLAVEIREHVAEIFVNGVPIVVHQAAELLAKRLSLGVGPRSAARFTRLVIRRPAAVAVGS